MEARLDEWATNLRECGCCIDGFTLQVKALELLRELGQYDGQFQASEGWLFGFLRRKNYSLRKITTSGRYLPTNFLKTIEKLHLDCEFLFFDYDNTVFDLNSIINMDETSVYLDRPSCYTYSKKVILSYMNNYIRISIISLIKNPNTKRVQNVFPHRQVETKGQGCRLLLVQQRQE